MDRSTSNQTSRLAEDAFVNAGDLDPSIPFPLGTMPQDEEESMWPNERRHESIPLSPPPSQMTTNNSNSNNNLTIHPQQQTDHLESQPSKPKSETLRKFQRAARQIINAQHIAKNACSQGVDVSLMDDVYGCIERQLDISVVDTCPTRHFSRTHMTNSQFLEWLEKPRPEWSTVRWINVNGMSWDVIKALALRYDLHRLAVEDMLHVPQRTKVDSYPNQTFVSCTMLSLVEEMEDGARRPVTPHEDSDGLNPRMLFQRIPLEHLDRFRASRARAKLGDLKVLMEQVSMFLLPDGVLLTFFQVSGDTMISSLMTRLGDKTSLVRMHSDTSFLLQAVLDGVVDHAIPIITAFRQEINDQEERVLAMPAMKYTRGLHRLARQLSLLRRTVVPTQSLVATLRKKDERSPLSSLARTYLGDVLDHCNTMVEDIDTMHSTCTSLIDMIFNLIAFETNEYMKRLAIVSIIFLPVTFVAGVYGTNFENFPELKNGIDYFWKICLACTCIVIGTFTIGWLYNQVKAYQIKRRLVNHDPISIHSRNRRLRTYFDR
ncbi:hypothetical protein BGW42_005907 [Actinomortierella wolfii]|nr:hypothetical protein BGW42_005907 [Actinomortierella wolfii]